MKHPLPRRRTLALLSALTLPLAHLHAQSVEPPPENESTLADDGTVLLSPFQVDTSKDRGYKATNATSGTRLNTAIKDAPLPIEVITNEFMRDIGATNLRDALSYSAGVILQSQADAFFDPQQGQDSQPGAAGANNPQGVTGSNSQTGTKLRGFIVDQTLRDGFRRQFTSDWINIERIEVVRGPEALLYGVGSFGGVYNYMPKRPLQTERYYASAQIGTHSFLRAELDATGPMGNSSWQPAYRVTAAWQENEDYTEWYQNKQVFVSPVFSFRPFVHTEVVIDNEFGHSRQDGNGFQSIRRSEPGSGAQQRGANFWPGSEMMDLRTYRMSGPDTYLETDFSNHVLDVTHRFSDDLFLRAGVSYNVVKRKSADVTDTTWNTNATEVFLQGDPLAIRPDGQPRQNTLASIVINQTLNDLFRDQNDPSYVPPQPRLATMRYKWMDRESKEERLQYRVEGNYQFEAWGKHSLLVGVQSQYREDTFSNRGPRRDNGAINVSPMEEYSYRNPYDLGAIRRGFQGDGLPDPIAINLDWEQQMNWDLGYYAAYQGRFWDDRITLIGGYRWDRNDARSYSIERDSGEESTEDRSDFSDEAPNEWSPQVGLSFRLNRALSVFGVYSTGLIPNYNQPNGYGELAPTKAKNVEYGLKFDLMEGRVSGTISAYKIERENTPRSVWWAPAPHKADQDPIDPGKPLAALWQNFSSDNVWYAVKFTPDGLRIAKEIFPSGWHEYLDRIAAVPGGGSSNGTTNNPKVPLYTDPNWGGWGQAGYPGDAWNGEPGHLWGDSNANTWTPGNTSNVYWPLVNIDKPEHLQFATNALWSMGEATPGAQFGWAGGFYSETNGSQFRFGDGTVGVRNIPHYNGTHVPINDEASGWDAQLILTPTDNWQILVNYANVKREITSQHYQYVSTPYYLPLAMYYYPVFGWGTIDARPVSEAYADPTDTSTFQVPIPEYGQALDDTPKHQASLWSNYSFANDTLRGWTVGLGLKYESERMYYNGFAVDGTANQVTINGVRVFTQFWTKERFQVDAMVSYQTRIADRYDLRVALNVNNLLDDQSRYGFIFAPGMTARLSTSISF